MRRLLGRQGHVTPLVLLIVLLASMPAARGAEPSLVHMDWQGGTSVVGLHGIGHPALNEARFDFSVGPCHRDLRLDLLYEPASIGAPDGSDPRVPYVFHAVVHDQSGARVSERLIRESAHGYPMGIVERPGTYVVTVRLEVGLAVDWDVRVRGFEVSGEPTCSLYLNEVEIGPTGEDAGAEWIEVYNSGPNDLDISGYQVWGVARRDHDPTAFRVPDGSVVPAGGHLHLALSQREAFEDVQEVVVLADEDGRPLDRSPMLTDDADDPRSWSRTQDGAHSWALGRATPGTANGG